MDPKGKPSEIARLLVQTNDILDDIVWGRDEAWNQIEAMNRETERQMLASIGYQP